MIRVLTPQLNPVRPLDSMTRGNGFGCEWCIAQINTAPLTLIASNHPQNTVYAYLCAMVEARHAGTHDRYRLEKPWLTTTRKEDLSLERMLTL
jgi:hypothetical protein